MSGPLSGIRVLELARTLAEPRQARTQDLLTPKK